MNSLLAGAASGLAATVPMTLAMGLMHQSLPEDERGGAVPPRQITMEVARQLGVRDALDEEQRFGLTMAAHFGYGAAAGLLFVPLTRRLRVPLIARGLLYGLGVWAVSYGGYLPVLGLQPSLEQAPAKRSAHVFASHLVWGLALGAVAALLTSPRSRR